MIDEGVESIGEAENYEPEVYDEDESHEIEATLASDESAKFVSRTQALLNMTEVVARLSDTLISPDIGTEDRMLPATIYAINTTMVSVVKDIAAISRYMAGENS